MRYILLFIISLSLLPITAEAKVVKSYIKKSGSYVAPHIRTNPNRTKIDNYSTKGNSNPFTGKQGTVDPIKR